MSEHERADAAPPGQGPARRGTFLPAAEPIAPKSVEEAGDLLMPVYAEPVVHSGATRAAGALPAAPELSFGVEAEPAGPSRLRRGGQIAAAGMIAALVAVGVAAFAPSPRDGSNSAYDDPALADVRPEPTETTRPLVAEGGRVRVGLHEADRDRDAPEAPAGEAREARDGTAQGAGGGSSPTAPQPSAPPSAPTSTPSGPADEASGSAAEPRPTPTTSTSAEPRPSAPASSAPAPTTSAAPSPSSAPSPTTAPSTPSPSQSASSEPSPSAAPTPTAPASLKHSTSCRTTRTGLLGLATANECTVTLTGEPRADVRISYGGLAWKTVTLDGSGRGAATARSADLLGLLDLVGRVLAGGEFSASYA
ncbi:hypothetical protein [Microbacterium rhizophilus]|uniref:hypothetical protein n=1 Tax=Microbacterium rhizophilus TaxID=3138934 RepID=UPI0031ED6F2E